jgi:hypothetical protein
MFIGSINIYSTEFDEIPTKKYVYFVVKRNDIELGSFLIERIRPRDAYGKEWLSTIIRILEELNLNVNYELFLRFGHNDVFLNYINELFPAYREGIEKYSILL